MENHVKNFLSFDKMITPTIIKVIFYAGLALSIFLSLGLIVSGMNARFGGGGQVLIGLISLVVSPIFVRVYCEILIIIFKINESLTDLRNRP